MRRRPRPATFLASAVAEYHGTFIRRVHLLLQLGYARMKPPANFARKEEEVITEFLVRAIDEVIDDRGTTNCEWASFFSVHEDPRVNAPGRHGKRRLRIDIRIDSREVSPRSRFLFEAKRLGKGHPSKTYLGVDGLGAYLTGEYAANDSAAGMIGYIQRFDATHWSTEIGNELRTNPAAYACQHGSSWQQEALVTGFPFIFSSSHDRNQPMTSIRIYHTFLLFH
jgi:hypothetical protein